jgi:hypothetical protein
MNHALHDWLLIHVLMVPFNAVFSLPHDGRCLVSARPRFTTLVPANGQGHVLTEAVRLVTTRGLGAP